MFDKVSRLAESTADGLSRRAFIGWLGKGALSAAALLGTAALARAQNVTCVRNGGCCGGATPYLRVLNGNGVSCSSDPTCRTNNYTCVPSTCCNGGGSCGEGVRCYSASTGCFGARC
jgi:hypothetical protein